MNADSDALWDEFDALDLPDLDTEARAYFAAVWASQFQPWVTSMTARLDQIEAARCQYTASTTTSMEDEK